MVKCIKEKNLTYADAAIMFNVKKTFVNRNMAAYKKNPEFLKKRQEKEFEKEEKTLLVLEEAENMLENSQDIWKSQQIVDQIQSSQNVEIKNDFACKILR